MLLQLLQRKVLRAYSHADDNACSLTALRMTFVSKFFNCFTKKSGLLLFRNVLLIVRRRHQQLRIIWIDSIKLYHPGLVGILIYLFRGGVE